MQGFPGMMPGFQAKAGGLMPGLGLPGQMPGLPGMRPQMGTLPGASLGGLPPNMMQGLTGLPGLQAGMLRPMMPGGIRPFMPGVRPAALASMAVATPKLPSAAVTAPAAKAAVPAGPVTPEVPPALPSAQPCTVYVGRISTEVSDDFVRQLLEKCGKVSKWNRAADPNTSKLTSFGFCDFKEPEGVWRALEFLHEKQLCDKKLLVKCEEKAKQTIDKWKETRREELAKKGAEEKKDGKDAAPAAMTDEQLSESLRKESEAVEEELKKMLEGKNKGYPEVSDNTDADKKAKEEEEKAAKEALEKAKKDEESKEDKDGDNKRKSGGDGKEDDKRRKKEEEEKEEKKSVLSRNYRVSRREREREGRHRDRERDVDKEYNYRLRDFERGEDRRIRTLKQDLKDLVPQPEPSDREKRKFVDNDLDFQGERDIRDWKRRREDKEKDRKKEHEKDEADRAAEIKEAEEEEAKKKEEEEKKKREAEEAAEKERKEKEEAERIEKEKERKKQEEIEKKEKEERDAREAKEREAKEVEKKKVQEDAAAKLLMSVQAEILNTPAAPKAAPPANIQALFKEPEELDANGQPRKHKPLTRLEGPPAEERKLRDDEMRRLIQQVPTDKARAFAFDIDWDAVNQYNIIEKKLRPWVKKKVTEYLGAEEQGMIEFIMRKVSAREKPDKILAELEGFLDEEAENFTLKMWRMLIFEVLRVKAAR